MIIEFDSRLACSIKDLAVKQGNAVKPTTRFFSGRMLMFAKISLISFIYDLIETFCFPNAKTKEIYKNYLIDFIYLYHILTDTDSTSIFFIFVCKPESSIPDEKYRYCLFEVVRANELLHRFDASHEFWEKFSVRDQSLRKKNGYYDIEQIDDPCEVTVAVNPKEYLKQFQSESVNKKHKGLKKGLKGMDSKNYSQKRNSVKDIETFGQLPQEKQGQFRFPVKRSNMVLEEIQNPKSSFFTSTSKGNC